MGAFDLNTEPVEGSAGPAVAPPPQDYTGWRPGFDLGDVFNGLDIGGRAGRTLVSNLIEGNGLDSFSRAGEAIMDSEKARSIGDIKQQIGIPTFGTEGDGFFREGGPANWDYGDIADVVIDTLGNTVTDPLAYLNFGATQAGARSLKAGQELIGSGLAAKGVLSPEMRSAALKRFTQQTGKVLPEGFIPGPNWKGVGETFGERLAQGDIGLGLQVPFLPSTRREITAPKSLQVAAGALADPLSTGVEALATTGIGKQVGKGVEWAKNTFLNPEVRSAFGLAARSAENVKRQVVDELSASLDTVDIRLADAGVPVEKWGLAHRLTELTDFDPAKQGDAALSGKIDVDADRRAVEEYAGVVPTKTTREAAGAKTLQQRYAETVAEINALDPKQRSAIYDASETFHRMNLQMRDKAAELGIPFVEMGKEVDNKIADRRRALTRMEQQIDDAIQAHTIKNRPPEADPNVQRGNDRPEPPKPSGLGSGDEAASGGTLVAPEPSAAGRTGVEDVRAETGVQPSVAPAASREGVGDGSTTPAVERGEIRIGQLESGRGTDASAASAIPETRGDVRRPATVVPSEPGPVAPASDRPSGRSRTAAATEAAAAKRDAERTSTPVLDKIAKLPPERQAEMMIRADKVAIGKKVDLEGLNDAEKKLLGQVREARKNLKRMGADVSSLESADEILSEYNRLRRETDNLGGRMASLDQMQDDGVKFSPDSPRGWGDIEGDPAVAAESRRTFNEYMSKLSPEQLKGTPRKALSRSEQHVLDIADALGMDIRFFDGLPQARGFFSNANGNAFNTRIIGLRQGMNAAELAHTFGHEFAHQAFSRLSKGGAEALLDSAKEILGSDFDRIMRDVTESYARNSNKILTPQAALEEILVDAGGKLFRDDGMEWITRAAKLDPTLYERFIAIIRDMAAKVESIIARVPKDKQGGLEGLARRLQQMEVRALELRKQAPAGAGVKFSIDEAAPDPYAIPKNELPEDIQAMMAQRDTIRNELSRLEQLKRETPSYTPHVINSKLDVVKAPGSTGSQTLSRGVKSKERGLRYENGEGAPLTLEEAEAEYAKGGGGSRATMGGAQKEAARMDAALRAITNGKEGLADLKKNLKDLTLFEQNPVLAYAKRIESFGVQMSNATMQRNLTNTFRAISNDAWNEALEAARAGKDEKEIRNAFEAATGTKLDDVLPEGPAPLADKLKSDKGLVAGPLGYQKVLDASGENEVWLPGAVADRYRRYLDTQKRGPEMLGALGGLLQGFTKYWKLSQTMPWPSFHIRNMVGDVFRLFQEDAFDGKTGQEIVGMTDALVRAGKAGVEGIDPRATIDLGKGGGVVPLKDFLKQVKDEGLFDTGILSEQVDSKITEIVNRNTGHNWKNIPKALSKVNNVLKQRENVMKAAAVATRMRQGDTFLEASLRAQDALFDYSQVSPAVDWLRKTGVAPFAAWFAKNIPAQIEWSLRNPGKLAALTRAYQKVSNGELSEDALPEQMQDRHNIVMSKTKDAKGSVVWNIATTEGLIPVDDILQLASNPNKSFQGLMGPLLKAAQELKAGPEKPGREDTYVSETADALIGKPLRAFKDVVNIGAIDPRTGEKTGAGDVLLSYVTPMKFKALKVEEQLKKAEARSKSQLGTFRNKLKDAEVALNDAAAAAEMDGNGQNGIEIPFWGDELRRLKAAVTLAQQEYQRDQARHDAEQKANQRMMRRATELSRAP